MQNLEIQKIDVDSNKLRELFDDQPKKKKIVQTALNIDRSTISKILTNKRKLEGGELLTIASVFEIDPFSLALTK